MGESRGLEVNNCAEESVGIDEGVDVDSNNGALSDTRVVVGVS